MTDGKVVVALAGPPNVGKSTIFNALTGSRQHVGNWPGKTVEKKEGVAEYGNQEFLIVDLPGTYSLSAHSEEERIARDFLLEERPSIIVAVVNAAAMERGLYLVSELLPLRIPTVVALNMVDVAVAKGLEVEPEVLEVALGIPVVPICAVKGMGLDKLMGTLVGVLTGDIALSPRLPQVDKAHRGVFNEIVALLDAELGSYYPVEWLALKLLEGDPIVTGWVSKKLSAERYARVVSLLKEHDDAFFAVVSGRYEWVNRMVRAAVRHPRRTGIAWAEWLDHWLTHPVWGLVALAGILGGVFSVSTLVGSPLQEWLQEILVAGGSAFVGSLFRESNPLLERVLTEGVIPGVGTVISFLPILGIYFGFLALLEDVGYLARAAFVTDRFMHLLGLHGRSFLPLMLGFGCNVPAIMGTRILETGRARLITILIAPFVPCSARLAVIGMTAPIFFGGWAPLVAIGTVAYSLLMLFLISLLLHRIMPGERAALIMELPLYNRPNIKSVARTVGWQVAAFLKKAGTVIVLTSLGVWGLTAFPGGEVHTSYLARLGAVLAPIGDFIGFDWRMSVAVLTSVVAKENSISTLAILLGGGEENFMELMRAVYMPEVGLSFLVVMATFVPCVPTLATIWKETGSVKWVVTSVVIMASVSFFSGAMIYRVAGLL